MTRCIILPLALFMAPFLIVATTEAFFVVPRSQTTKIVSHQPRNTIRSRLQDRRRDRPMFMSDQQDEDRLKQLGFTEDEIRRSNQKSDPDIKVKVNVIKDVDPFTLTAIGFALIAMNFLVFANLGDGGIAGVVATIINTSRQ